METTSHPHGTFCIAELQSADPSRSAAYYRALMNWTMVEVPETAGGYARFQLNGRDVATMRRRHRGPDLWVPRVCVENVDRTAARSRELGATIIDTYDAAGIARLATIQDPEGAVFGLWQTEPHHGAQIMEETGSLWWVEVLSNNPAAAAAFYTNLFDWTTGDVDLPPIGRYTVFKSGNEQSGGLLTIGEDWGVSPRWNVIYAVDSCETFLEGSKRLGGSLEFMHDVPRAGRIASLYDSGKALLVIRGPIL